MVFPYHFHPLYNVLCLNVHDMSIICLLGHVTLCLLTPATSSPESHKNQQFHQNPQIHRMHQNRQIPRIYKFARIASIAKFTIFVRITRNKAEKQSKDALEKLIIYKFV